jgi:hypothetical protein
MKLADMHYKYGTDKGVTHNYIDKYDEVFENRRTTATHVMEIGVLFGNSLRMWHDFFENAIIYGIDDFSQRDGHAFYEFAPVNEMPVEESLKGYQRVRLGKFSCTDMASLTHFIGANRFDVIIDDGSHTIEQQLNNIINLYPLLRQDGIYVCEDVASASAAKVLVEHVKNFQKFKSCDVFEFDIKARADDRMLIITKE